MGVLEQLCTDCGYEAAFSSPNTCGEGCTEDKCGSGCGVSNCLVWMCPANIVDYMKSKCDPLDPESNQIVFMQLEESGYPFYATDETILPETEETYDPETKTCTVNETIIGRAKTGVAEYTWAKKSLSDVKALFLLDNCGRVRAYGIDGNTYLVRYKETPGDTADSECYVEYEFQNTKDTFCYVNYTIMGFATGEDFMAGLIA